MKRRVLGWPKNLTDQLTETEGGCILWTGGRGSKGYGVVRHADGRDLMAHRAYWELFVGPIPEDMTLDHECHNRDETCAGGPTCIHRRCVNPEHLAVKSAVDNLKSSKNYVGNKTHCPRGHAYADYGQTSSTPAGPRRYCKLCKRDKTRARRAAGLDN